MKPVKAHSTRWIVIAKITRPHGVFREGVFHYRIALAQRGSHSLQNAKEIALAPKGFDPQNPKSYSDHINNKIPFETYPLSQTPSPLGGKWDHAEAAILSFKESDLPANEQPHQERSWVDRWVALERDSFPAIADTEFYLCDLVGLPVKASKESSSLGTVIGFFEMGKSSQFNVLLRPLGGAETGEDDFEFPLKTIDWSESQGDEFLVVPMIEEWRNL